MKRISPLLWLASLLALIATQHCFALSAPMQHIYTGHLYANGAPVTTPQTIRFSFWKTGTVVSGDSNTNGTINDAAPSYGGWKEVQTVTPNASGYFALKLGSITPIDYANMPPDVISSLFLQVDVKEATAPLTDYETLDVDPLTATVDRSPVGAVPFASNANLLDQHAVGTNAGDIPVLGTGGTLPTSLIAPAIDSDTFTLDANNTSASEISLRFGDLLGKKLAYDTVAQTFKFNDSVHIDGNLTVTGLVNGVDLSTINNEASQLKVSSGA